MSRVGAGVALVLGLFAAVRGMSQLPDPSTGEIGGRTALNIWPAAVRNGKVEPISPWGFNVHLTEHDVPAVDEVFPCGIWFQPRPGWYRAWAEGDWQISRYSLLMSYAGERFRGHGRVAAIPVVAAGRVALPREVRPDPQVVLRLLHAGSYLEGEFPRWELARRKATPGVGQGVLMPAGLTLAALWDERSQSYTAISRPFEVKARQTVVAPLEQPSKTVHLVAQIQRPATARDAGELALDLLLRSAGGELRPDLKVLTAERAYAVWYGLAPGPAEFQAKSRQGTLAAPRLDLAPGMIARFVGELKPWISLSNTTAGKARGRPVRP